MSSPLRELAPNYGFATFAFAAFTMLFASSLTSHAQTDVLTWHNDNARTGQNLAEAILTPAQVNATDFGLLANLRVDGKVDAQPLYVSALVVPGLGTHNVLFIATEHDSVYAVDADSGKLYWRKSMLASNETPSDNRNCSQVVPEIGITATPVIDRHAGAHGTIYVVAMTKDGPGSYNHRVHALDLTTGAEQFNGPVVVKATYPGTGDGSVNGTVEFNAAQYKDRPALFLLNGNLYTSWSSHCDARPYTGWMIAYNQNTLQQSAVLNFVPNGSDAAPWNAGAGPAVDASGNIYVSLGNGDFDTTFTAQGLPSRGDLGNSVVKVALQNSRLVTLDYWTMYNSNSESANDTDLGSGGAMLLPDLRDASGVIRHLGVAAGKDWNLYVFDRDKMGHYNPSSNATLYQELARALPGGMWSSPAYFNNRIYYGAVGSNLRSFGLSEAKVVAAPIQTTLDTFNFPGTTPSISAYKQTNGIVWATENTNPAILRAYDAADLNRELYNSNQAAYSRDHFGTGNKFIVPTIAGGKVYVATTNSVAIFGYIRHSAPPIPDGDYIVTNDYSKLVLDDPGFSTRSGISIYQWQLLSGNNQKWFFSFNGKGFYTIQNVSSGLLLVDPNTTPGTKLQQSNPTNDDRQLWSLTAAPGGFVIRNKASGLVIDEYLSSLTWGAYVDLGTANKGANQTWAIQ